MNQRGNSKKVGLEAEKTFSGKKEKLAVCNSEKDCLNLIREVFKLLSTKCFSLQIVRILFQLKLLMDLKEYRACSK